MINFQDNEIKTKAHELELRKTAQEILNLLDYSDFDLAIYLFDNKQMQRFNREYRKVDKVTDILSFSFHPHLKPGERINPKTPDDKNLGDIIIAPAYVKEDCKNWNQTFKERMRVLLVHGVCHLLGYDHQTDEDYAVMKEKEDWLLQKLAKHNE